jgi:hypothetical protein
MKPMFLVLRSRFSPDIFSPNKEYFILGISVCCITKTCGGQCNLPFTPHVVLFLSFGTRGNYDAEGSLSDTHHQMLRSLPAVALTNLAIPFAPCWGKSFISYAFMDGF